MKLFRAAIACASLLAASFAAPAAYPDKPIKFIVTFPAGGMTDILARNIGSELSKRLGQPVVIDNRAGMGGSIGAQAGAKAVADGYTFTFANVGAMTLNTVLYKDVGYDPLKDFTPVAGVAAVPNIVAVPADSPYKTLAELVEYARRNPGKMNYASTGTGASPGWEPRPSRRWRRSTSSRCRTRAPAPRSWTRSAAAPRSCSMR